MSVTIKVDASEVIAALDALEDKDATKVAGTATKKGAQFLAGKTRPLAPVGKEPKPAAKRLRRRISVRAAKRDKPGAVITVRAAHRHLVIRGTARRFTASGANRGVMPSNPFIDKAADMHGDAALDLAMDEIASDLGLD